MSGYNVAADEINKGTEMPKVKDSDRAFPKMFKELISEASAFAENDDCGVITLAAILEIRYDEAHKLLQDAGRENRQRTNNVMLRSVILAQGYNVKELSIRNIIRTYPGNNVNLKGMTMHHPVRFSGVFPHGRLLAFMRGHVAAIVDGVVIDYTRGSTKKVISLHEVTRTEEE